MLRFSRALFALPDLSLAASAEPHANHKARIIHSDYSRSLTLSTLKRHATRGLFVARTPPVPFASLLQTGVPPIITSSNARSEAVCYLWRRDLVAHVNLIW